MKDNNYPYLKLNVRDDQHQRITRIAAERSAETGQRVTLIEVVDDALDALEKWADAVNGLADGIEAVELADEPQKG